MKTRKLNIVILGASGIGQYHAREFSEAGCDVVAILGQTKESSKKTSEMLKKEFKIEAKPYSSLSDLLNENQLNAASICTPPDTHEQFIRRCLESGLDVLCEKPLIADEKDRVYEKTKELLRFAKSKGKILTVNTQWASVLGMLGIDSINKSLLVYTQPIGKGKDLLLDHLPHGNSLLVKLVPDGIIKVVHFTQKGEEEIRLKFRYQQRGKGIDVDYRFKHKAQRPRKIEMIFDGKKWEREIGEGYRQIFKSYSRAIEIEDPFKISISKFLDSVNNKGEPLITEKEMLESAKLQDKIMRSYER